MAIFDILWKYLMLGHRQVMVGSISARNVMEDLSLDVAQERTGSDAEQVRLGPLITQLFLHHGQPGQRVLGCTDTSRRLETNLQNNIQIWIIAILKLPVVWTQHKNNIQIWII